MEIEYIRTEFNRIKISGNFCNGLPCEKSLHFRGVSWRAKRTATHFTHAAKM